jgi:hypothetical protein
LKNARTIWSGGIERGPSGRSLGTPLVVIEDGLVETVLGFEEYAVLDFDALIDNESVKDAAEMLWPDIDDPWLVITGKEYDEEDWQARDQVQDFIREWYNAPYVGFQFGDPETPE